MYRRLYGYLYYIRPNRALLSTVWLQYVLSTVIQYSDSKVLLSDALAVLSTCTSISIHYQYMYRYGARYSLVGLVYRCKTVLTQCVNTAYSTTYSN